MRSHVLVAFFLCSGCAGLAARGPTELAPPRLVVRPAGDVTLSGRGKSRVLRFEMAVENRGRGPLEVLGRRDGSRVVGIQRVIASDGRDSFVDHERSVGELFLDEHHGHWHLDGFARFELLDDRFAPVPGARAAAKTSACLRDVERVPDVNGLADPSYRECVPEKQGISPGWADVYERDLPGQEMVIGSLPEGTYWLVITLTAPFESAGPASDRFAATKLEIDDSGARVVERLYGASFVARRTKKTALRSRS